MELSAYLRDCSKIFFAKLAKYIGHGIKALIDRPDGKYCFRLHRDRVYYVSESQVQLFAHQPLLPPGYGTF